MKVILNAAVIGMIISLSFVCCTDEDSAFEVRVVDPDSMPVECARVEGGFDWTQYTAYTDSNGFALVPGHGRGESATIYKEGYFPRSIDKLESRVYAIDPTARVLRMIGEARGSAIIFDADTLVTIWYSGEYNVYTYNDQSVTLISSCGLVTTAKNFKIHGDTLWFGTHDDGIYAFSLENILQPELLIHINIPGYPGIFAIKDSIVAVGPDYGLGALRIFTYDNSGQAQLLISMLEFTISAMEFIGSYLVVAGGAANMPAVFDVSNPAQPVLVYNHYESNAHSGFIRDNMLVIVPAPWTQTYVYKRMDISSPWNPSYQGSFSADSWLYDLVDGEYAVGLYGTYYVISVLTGDIVNGFTTNATIPWLYSYEGSRPPYFLFQDQLWILEPR